MILEALEMYFLEMGCFVTSGNSAAQVSQRCRAESGTSLSQASLRSQSSCEEGLGCDDDVRAEETQDIIYLGGEGGYQLLGDGGQLLR